jgi:hypothetical protein
LQIFDAGGPVVTLPSLNQPLDLRFGDGNMTLTQTGAEQVTVTGADGGSEVIAPGAIVTPGVTLGADTSATATQDPPADGFTATADVSIAPDAGLDAVASELTEATQSALDAWTQFLTLPQDLTIQVDIGSFDTANNTLATGASEFRTSNPPPESGVHSTLADKLITGNDADDESADASFEINLANLEDLDFTAPFDPSQINGVQTLTHEFGHALGILQSPAPDLFDTVWDTFVEGSGSNLVFTGQNTVAANGGAPVPLEPDDRAHLSEDAFSNALMTPTSIVGTDDEITEIEIGILRDLGFDVVANADTLLG